MKIISVNQVKKGETNPKCLVGQSVILTNRFNLPRKLKKKLYGTKSNRKFLSFNNSDEAYSFSCKMREYRKFRRNKHPFSFFNSCVLGETYTDKINTKEK